MLRRAEALCRPLTQSLDDGIATTAVCVGPRPAAEWPEARRQGFKAAAGGEARQELLGAGGLGSGRHTGARTPRTRPRAPPRPARPLPPSPGKAIQAGGGEKVRDRDHPNLPGTPPTDPADNDLSFPPRSSP